MPLCASAKSSSSEDKRIESGNFLLLFVERINPSPLSGNMFPDAYPSRSTSALNSQPDLSRATRYDAHLLAIVRIEDKRSKRPFGREDTDVDACVRACVRVCVSSQCHLIRVEVLFSIPNIQIFDVVFAFRLEKDDRIYPRQTSSSGRRRRILYFVLL